MQLSPEVIKDVIEWDVENWKECIPFWEQYCDFSANNKFLALGERNGGLSLWLALSGAKVICSDINPPTPKAIARHKKYKVEHNINYEIQDMMNIKYPDNYFDFVVFKSVIGRINIRETQKNAINEIYRVLKPGGKLLFAENLTSTIFHRILRKKNKFRGWRYLNYKKDIPFCFEKFSFIQTHTHGFLATLGRREWQREMLSKLDGLICKFLPSRYHYIVFGVAEK
jgi:ubiquinone/menaquinone biosynthesis C-methylase UbiE